jgi:hypothetical protein
MTGMSSDGTLTTLSAGFGASTNCKNWTDTSDPNGMVGSDGASGAGTWLSNVLFTCNSELSLICMGRTKNVAVAPLVMVGKKIWLSNAAFTPGAGQTPDAACQAGRPAGVTTAAALIAYTTKPASSVLIPAASYVRPDGTFVATGAQLASTPADPFAGVSLTSGVWQFGNGGYLQSNGGGLELVWTGQSTITSPGTTASTCGNWTDSTQIASGVGAPNWTYNNWWSYQKQTCLFSLPIYCVQTAP